MKYMLGAIHQAPPIIAPATSAITGSFAPQGTKVDVIMVIRRFLSSSMVLVAMMAGTPQPEEISSGIKLFPDNPNLRKIRSMINATLAMYPQSSRTDKNRKRIAI